MKTTKPHRKADSKPRRGRALAWMAFLGAGLAMASCLEAADYSIPWFTIDGGGGTSTGGVYSVSGTIGQPDAGRMSGGNYTLEGGFWSVMAIQTPGAPWLSITRTNGNFVVSWPLPATGFLLEQTPALTTGPASWAQTPWPYVTNQTDIRVTLPPTAGNLFLRLRQTQGR